MTKSCPGCGQTRDLAEFNFKNRASGKRQVYCRECSRKYVREHYAQNREYYIRKALARNRVRRRDFLDRILEYLRLHPCVDCGEKDPLVLEFDHVDAREKNWDIAMMVKEAWGWRTIQAEIEKCVVRCANDHRRRTARQFGWYRLDALQT